MRKTSNVENDKNDFDKNDHNTKSGSFLSSRPWWGGRCGPGQTPEICQFAFAQAENLTNKWENMQKSWRKTQNRCKRKRKKWRNEGICYPKTGDAGPKTGDAGLKTGDLGTPKKDASPVDALRKTRPNPQHKKWMETEITTLFEQLLLPKLLPCRFISTFIYKQREKSEIKYW